MPINHWELDNEHCLSEIEAHVHDSDCLVTDTVDLGDDGDGYVAHTALTCNITGGKWNE